DALEAGAPRELASPAALALFAVAVLGAPLAWLASLQWAYSLAGFACETDRGPWVFRAISVGGLVCIAIVATLGWRLLGRSGHGTPDDARTERHRSRFLAVLGLLTSTQLFLALVAQAIATVVLPPCP